MRGATVIRHVAFEDLGSFEPVLSARGYQIERLDAGLHELSRLQHAQPELLFVLGGPISVNDGSLFPFLAVERALLADRLARDLPTIGICLGAQLMAVALGGAVAPMKTKEIGFGPLSLTEAGAHSELAALGDAAVLHWHGEAFTLPQGAELLASTPECTNQAFSWKRNGLGLQFHLEASASELERWYIGHVVELGRAGVSIPSLRAEAARQAGRLQERACATLERWLDARGL